MQNGAGVTFKIANSNEMAAKPFSPPDSGSILFKFFPGGWTLISISLSRMSCSSESRSSALPPPNNSEKVSPNAVLIKRNLSRNCCAILSVSSRINLLSSSRERSTSEICSDINSYRSETSLYSSIAETLTEPSARICPFNSFKRLVAAEKSSISISNAAASRRVRLYSSNNLAVRSSYSLRMAILRSSKRASSPLKFSRSTDLARSKVRKSLVSFSSVSRFASNSSICARAVPLFSRSVAALAFKFSIFFSSSAFFASYAAISLSKLPCLSVWLNLRFSKCCISSRADCASFSSAIICSRNSDTFCDRASRAAESASRSPVNFSSACSFSRNSAVCVSNASRAAAAFSSTVSIRCSSISFSSANSRTVPDTEESCSSASFNSPSRRIFSSFARNRSPCAPSNSARAAARSSVNSL